ncbi:hypothetical protein ACWES4_21495, partial [Streptomyces sp. NPDC004011]
MTWGRPGVAEGGARVGAGGLELPPGGEGHEGSSTDAPPGAVSLARGRGGPGGGAEPGAPARGPAGECGWWGGGGGARAAAL